MRWLFVLAFVAILGVACGSSSDSDSNTDSNSGVDMADETITTASGLQIKTIVVGTGDKAEPGKTFRSMDGSSQRQNDNRRHQ